MCGVVANRVAWKWNDLIQLGNLRDDKCIRTSCSRIGRIAGDDADLVEEAEVGVGGNGGEDDTALPEKQSANVHRIGERTECIGQLCGKGVSEIVTAAANGVGNNDVAARTGGKLKNAVSGKCQLRFRLKRDQRKDGDECE